MVIRDDVAGAPGPRDADAVGAAGGAGRDARKAAAPRVLPMGESAFLIELDTLDAVTALHSALAATAPAGVIELVPAARTVLVRVDARVLPLPAARAWAFGAVGAGAPTDAAVAPLVEIGVAYDGDDLAETAGLLGVAPDDLVARHAAAEWRVAFTGFAPGFGYLVSDDWPFEVPRLSSPRTRVPAGAVGLAGGFSGAYPRETPGGWRLIGRTDAALFDPHAERPVLLAPGTRVRFRPFASPMAEGARSSAPMHAETAEPRGIRILEPGLLSTVQDLGRDGCAVLGVARSGALDRAALRTANRLVGNAESAAGIEVTMGGLRAVTDVDAWFAVTGAWGPIRIDGRAVDPYTAHAWAAGQELHLDWFDHGARAYLAVRGGIDADVVLGSRASDVMAGLGRSPLAAGDAMGVRGDVGGPVPVSPPSSWGAPNGDEVVLEVAAGPRAEWFALGAVTALFDAVWTVSNQADRVGVRLDGPLLERVHSGELASEGMVPGAIQVPPSGRPTVLFADGPVTGGYPVIAVVTDASLDLLAQAGPGTRIRFRHARAHT